MPNIAALYNYPLYTGDTTGFHIIANDGGETTTYKVHTETIFSEFTYTNTYTASTTWSVVHNLNSDFPVVTAWDTNRKVVIPTDIYSVNTNNIEVYFSQPIAGTISLIKVL